MLGRRFVLTNQVTAPFCMKSVTQSVSQSTIRGPKQQTATSRTIKRNQFAFYAAKMWDWRWTDEISAFLVDAYLRKEHSCPFLSWSDLKQWRLRLFTDGDPYKKKNNKMSSNMRSVPDLKSVLIAVKDLSVSRQLTSHQTSISLSQCDAAAAITQWLD